MADEANALAATQPAPAAPATDGTAPVTPAAPVSGDPNQPVTDGQAKPEKTFTQAELESIVRQRLARQQRQYEREQQQRQPVAQSAAEPQQPQNAAPIPENFRTTEEYIRAAAQHEARQIIAQEVETRERNTRAAQQANFEANLERTFREREDKAALVHPDYHSLVYDNPEVVISTPMALAIKQAENGPDIAVYLGKNPQESQRIARLHPLAQAMEIGMIRGKVSAASPVSNQSGAPQPIPSVRTNTTLPAFDTTDPRSVQQLSNGSQDASAWIKADRERQRRLAEGRNR